MRSTRISPSLISSAFPTRTLDPVALIQELVTTLRVAHFVWGPRQDHRLDRPKWSPALVCEHLATTRQKTVINAEVAQIRRVQALIAAGRYRMLSEFLGLPRFRHVK